MLVDSYWFIHVHVPRSFTSLKTANLNQVPEHPKDNTAELAEKFLEDDDYY